MVKVGMPYLESGESLVLTTDRVRVNTVQYDILLTTRYLLLVDARYTQFEPRMIPLLTIQSVKGGETAYGDPVITLFFADTDGSTQSEPMVLLFSQQSGEQRKRERDTWFKTLMGLIVSVRQDDSADSTTTAATDIGIRPSKKRAITPEIPHPFTKIVESHPSQPELNIIHDEPESLDFSEERQQYPETSPHEEKQEPEVPSASGTAEALPKVSPDLTAPFEAVSSSESTTKAEFTGEFEEISICRVTLIPEPASGLIPLLRELTDSSELLSPQESITAAEFTEEFGEISICRVTLIPEPASGLIPLLRELTDSRDLISSLSGAITAKFAGEYQEKPAAREMTSPVPVKSDEGIPVIPETDVNGEEPALVSLLASVKSLTSPIGRNQFPETGSQFPQGKEPCVISLDEAEPPGTRICKDREIISSHSATEEQPGPKPPRVSSTTDENLIAIQETMSPLILEPVKDESPPIPGQESLTEPVLPEAGRGSEAVQQSPMEATPPSPGLPPPSAGPGSCRKSIIAVAIIVIIILGIAGAVVLYPKTQAAPAPEPTPLPTPTIQQTPQPTPVIVPSTGVWVRVDYPRTYSGWIGNTGAVRAVNGSGVRIYAIPERDGIVEAQVHKTDNSGDTLTVEVYRDGNVINQRNVSIPMGSIDILVDAKTGNPPGLTPVITPTANQTGSAGPRIMYF